MSISKRHRQSDQKTKKHTQQQQVHSAQVMKLLVKQRELKAAHDLFAKVSRLEAHHRQRWLEENSELVADAFYSFLEHSQESLVDIETSQESINVTADILDLLDKTTRLMDELFESQTRLES